MRPDTYKAALALAIPVIKALRAIPWRAGDPVKKTIECPACAGNMRIVRADLNMNYSARCDTPFCVQVQQWRQGE